MAQQIWYPKGTGNFCLESHEGRNCFSNPIHSEEHIKRQPDIVNLRPSVSLLLANGFRSSDHILCTDTLLWVRGTNGSPKRSGGTHEVMCLAEHVGVSSYGCPNCNEIGCTVFSKRQLILSSWVQSVYAESIHSSKRLQSTLLTRLQVGRDLRRWVTNSISQKNYSHMPEAKEGGLC